METSTILFAIMSATLLVVALHAWRLGNERRDVALLGTIGGVCGLGAAFSALT